VNFYGISIQQTWVHLFFHLDAVSKYEVKTFIEIGTASGGTAALMIPDIRLNGLRYFGVEKDGSLIDTRLRAEGCNFIIGDEFDGQIIAQIRTIVNESKGRALIFCDGGNKPKELEIYSKLLRKGDLIEVHDFMSDGDPVNEEAIKWICNDPNFKEIDIEYRHVSGAIPMWMRI
jgi:cephalosporin hydroxylase